MTGDVFRHRLPEKKKEMPANCNVECMNIIPSRKIQQFINSWIYSCHNTCIVRPTRRTYKLTRNTRGARVRERNKNWTSVTACTRACRREQLDRQISTATHSHMFWSKCILQSIRRWLAEHVPAARLGTVSSHLTESLHTNTPIHGWHFDYSTTAHSSAIHAWATNVLRKKNLSPVQWRPDGVGGGGCEGRLGGGPEYLYLRLASTQTIYIER